MASGDEEAIPSGIMSTDNLAGSDSAEKEKDVQKFQFPEQSREKGDFGEKGKFEDEVTLKFDDDDEMYVSANFLKMASPVFTRMLESDFKEKATRVITLKGKDSDDFLELLWFLHPAIQKRITGTTVFRIIPLAEEYEILSAISDCKCILTGLINSAVWPDADWSSIQLERRVYSGTEDSSSIEVDYIHCKSLRDCLKALDVAVKFSYRNIELLALERISKYPSRMYTQQFDSKDIDNFTNCFEPYSRLAEREKVIILKRRLDIKDVTFKKMTFKFGLLNFPNIPGKI